MSRAWSEEPIFLPGAEIAKRVSMTSGEWEAAAVVLERSGLPRRDPLFKNQRCWPRVRNFLYAATHARQSLTTRSGVSG